MNKMMEKIAPNIPNAAKTDVFGNAAAFEVPLPEIASLARDLHENKHLSLKLITATDEREEQGCFKIWYVFGAPVDNVFIIPYIRLVKIVDFPSLTPFLHQAWNHERKIRTFFGLNPTGHPDASPVLLHENWPDGVFPLRKDFAWNTRPDAAHGEYRFQQIDGEGIYEIPVGPVHAGIIEPGHFRFSVAGEEIMLLEPRLGFTHKGSEKLFERLPLNEKVQLSEKISGDSSFSHSLAFCQAVEQLGGVQAPQRAQVLRVIYAELERLANHFGDIGAIMLDAGFNFGGSHGARLREIILRINERTTGSRFLRGVNTIGGVTKDIDADQAQKLAGELMEISEDFGEIIDVAENSESLLNRLKTTGTLAREVALNHGVVGVAARAVGIPSDARIDFPYAAYNELRLEKAETEQDGDVYARFHIRVKEAGTSLSLLQRALRNLPAGPILAPGREAPLEKNAAAVGIVEGWRGEIVYFLKTDALGNISRVAIRDPSFMNWTVLEHAAPGNIVPDFPLINKSFNLSYSGNDL